MPTSHPFDCYSCAHSLTCFFRIETVRTIQSFKLLAESREEAKNTQRPETIAEIWAAIAGACTAYKAQGE